LPPGPPSAPPRAPEDVLFHKKKKKVSSCTVHRLLAVNTRSRNPRQGVTLYFPTHEQNSTADINDNGYVSRATVSYNQQHA
jgi:hypothetical protein